jgi:hypothetical protein
MTRLIAEAGDVNIAIAGDILTISQTYPDATHEQLNAADWQIKLAWPEAHVYTDLEAKTVDFTVSIVEERAMALRYCATLLEQMAVPEE